MRNGSGPHFAGGGGDDDAVNLEAARALARLLLQVLQVDLLLGARRPADALGRRDAGRVGAVGGVAARDLAKEKRKMKRGSSQKTQLDDIFFDSTDVFFQMKSLAYLRGGVTAIGAVAYQRDRRQELGPAQHHQVLGVALLDQSVDGQQKRI